MLPALSKETKDLLANCKGMVISGLASIESPDSSGEIVSIKGIDLSNVKEGTVLLNVEHKGPKNGSFESVIGHCLYSKKLYSADDCEDQDQLDFWNIWELPCLYTIFELYDQEEHKGAQAAASILRYYKQRDMISVLRLSVEGSVLDRDQEHQHIITNSIIKAIALTATPCNHASRIAVLLDSNKDNIEKTEEYKDNFKSIYTDIKDEDIVVDSVHLNKALTLGSYDASPGNLSGGAALAVEDVSGKKKKEMFKNQVMAALRDWDGTGAFATFLKHRLPDVSEDFIEKFSDLSELVRIKKNEAELTLPRPSLKQLDSKLPHGSVAFKGKKVLPGEVEIVSGPFQDSKLKLLGLDDNYVYVKPFKAGDDFEVKINKISRIHEGQLFIILKDPEPLDVPNHVHAEKHGDDLNLNFKQKALIHGIDLASEPLIQSHPNGSTEARTKGTIGWFKSSHDKLGYVKPAVNYFGNNGKETLDASKVSTARREVIFYNIANSFWGLGNSIPTTALFKHPDTKEEHSVMELIPDAHHVKINSNSHDPHDALRVAGDTGFLDKLAIMDTVMGQADRERVNYMISNQHPYVFLIDNALCLNFNDDYIPAYLHDYYHLSNVNLEDAPIHPEARAWLMALDPFILSDSLIIFGVNPQLAQAAAVRLMCMQSAIMMGSDNIVQILFSYSNYSNLGARQ